MIRLRMLIDVTVHDEEVMLLGRLCGEQSPAILDIEGFRPLRARFMGANPVEVETFGRGATAVDVEGNGAHSDT